MLQNAPMYSYIPAKDVPRARKFYEEKLGFTPREELAGGVTYAFGDHTACFLYPTPNAGTSRQRMPSTTPSLRFTWVTSARGTEPSATA